jgi:hypothetical protein
MRTKFEQVCRQMVAIFALYRHKQITQARQLKEHKLNMSISVEIVVAHKVNHGPLFDCSQE